MLAFICWRHLNLLHCADEPPKGQNSCPWLQPYFISFCPVGVSQSQLFYLVYQSCSFSCIQVFWLIRSLADPTLVSSIIVGGPLLILCVLYYFGTVGLNRSDMLSFFSMVLPTRFMYRWFGHLHISLRKINMTLSTLPCETAVHGCNHTLSVSVLLVSHKVNVFM